MSYRVPDSPDTHIDSTSSENSFFSISESAMSSGAQNIDVNMNAPLDQEFTTTTSQPLMLPQELWSLPYITHSEQALATAIKANPTLVAQLFANSTVSNVKSFPALDTRPQPALRLSAPQIYPFDGQPGSLRAFISQMTNLIQGQDEQLPTEMDKVRYAYQCLGPEALSKMRSSFRCLEDPSIPAEITTLSDFITALKQRCQDPGLEEKASCTIDGLQQKNMRFHDFITIFEDNMADSSYGKLDKSQWRVMLQRRLSTRLRNALVMASDAPTNYHDFVTYLRKKDAAFQEIYASRVPSASWRPQNESTQATQVIQEPTVSQGGSAMDLDMISREKGPDGRLTAEAKNARRALGRCLWCNKTGHLVSSCPRNSRTIASNITESPSQSDNLKEKLQQ